MNASQFHAIVKDQFPFEPTLKQDIVLQQLSNFIFDTTPNGMYVLKGFAGTGKTTIIGTLVNNLWKAKKKCGITCAYG
jgi:exodeoxyribonuclease-5